MQDLLCQHLWNWMNTRWQHFTHAFLSWDSNLEIQEEVESGGNTSSGGSVCSLLLDNFHSLDQWNFYFPFFFFFIITEILIPPKYPAVYFHWLSVYLSSGRFRMGRKRQKQTDKKEGENGWWKQYQGTGLHYSSVLRQILNENPCKGDRGLYLIKPL